MIDRLVERFVRKYRHPACSMPAGSLAIAKLRELDRELDFKHFARTQVGDPTIVDLLVRDGAARSYWLYDCPEVSVARTVFTDGAHFQEHTHDQIECWIVYKGYLQVTIDGIRVDSPEKRSYYVYPGSLHSVTAIGETEIIVVSIPRSPEFPRGPEQYG